jgi:Fe-S-cluster formation regulator IscX/YfhJ
MTIDKKIKYVFQQKNYTKILDGNTDFTVLDYDIIHGPGYDTMYNILKSNNMAELYYDDQLPDDVFVYSYQEHWWFAVEEFFKKNDGFLDKNPCPEHVLQRIKNKTAYLLITITSESPIQNDRMRIIHEYFIDSGIPSSQVIYYTCSPNAQNLYDNFCKTENELPTLTFDYCPYYVLLSSALYSKNDDEYKVETRQRDFLMFNRRWGSHPQRVLMLYYLHKMSLLDKFFISFTKTEIDNNGAYTDHFNRFMSYMDIETPSTDALTEIENILPLVLDKKITVTDSLMFGKFDTTNEFYNNSMIHLVAETFFFSEIIHFTEKTFKPIVYKQPFVMLSAAGSLKSIKALGFKTFSEIWDESYDDIDDDKIRFTKILELIKELCSLSDEQKNELMTKCKPIIEYNHKFLYDRRSDFLVRLVDKVYITNQKLD